MEGDSSGPRVAIKIGSCGERIFSEIKFVVLRGGIALYEEKMTTTMTMTFMAIITISRLIFLAVVLAFFFFESL